MLSDMKNISLPKRHLQNIDCVSILLFCFGVATADHVRIMNLVKSILFVEHFLQ